MKIVLGVDSEVSYAHALNWLIRLRFRKVEVLMTAVLEPLRPPLGGILAPLPEEVLRRAASAGTGTPAGACGAGSSGHASTSYCRLSNPPSRPVGAGQHGQARLVCLAAGCTVP
jgi:hypothetical protein